ncbi:MAG: cytochrome b [Alphaproteobacteria bacterium]
MATPDTASDTASEAELTSKDKQAVTRYNNVAIILHWVIGIAIIGMLCSGFAMAYLDLDRSLIFQIIQWHKAFGVLILLAVGLRILWRIWSWRRGEIPPLPDKFPKLENLAAHLGHIGLYVAMLAMPLSGWVMVSSSPYGLPTLVFGYTWPHLPGIALNEAVNSASGAVHYWLAWGLVALLVGHIGAVIKHRLMDNENLLTRIWWTKTTDT